MGRRILDQDEVPVGLRRDGDYIRDACRHCGRAVHVVSPRDRCAVSPQREAVIIARGDGYDICGVWRWCALAVVISSPPNHCAIGLEAQAMVTPRCNCYKTVSTRWRGLAVVI